MRRHPFVIMDALALKIVVIGHGDMKNGGYLLPTKLLCQSGFACSKGRTRIVYPLASYKTPSPHPVEITGPNVHIQLQLHTPLAALGFDPRAPPASQECDKRRLLQRQREIVDQARSHTIHTSRETQQFFLRLRCAAARRVLKRIRLDHSLNE